MEDERACFSDSMSNATWLYAPRLHEREKMIEFIVL